MEKQEDLLEPNPKLSDTFLNMYLYGYTCLCLSVVVFCGTVYLTKCIFNKVKFRLS